jgi:hypothetical protein
LPGAVEYHSTLIEPHAWSVEMSDIERVMFMDLVCYLLEDILTKLDRASMAVSLENRAFRSSITVSSSSRGGCRWISKFIGDAASRS